MSGCSLLRAADRREQPWKNGGGVTMQVCAHPPGVGLDDFAWRVSIADITEAGEFSCFAGIDRVLAVIAGRLELRIAGETVLLDTTSSPAAFAADTPVYGQSLDGGARDVNLMVRRDGWRGRMRRAELRGTTTSAATTIVLAEAATAIVVGGAVLELGVLDGLRLEPGQHVAATGLLLVIEIDPS